MNRPIKAVAAGFKTDTLRQKWSRIRRMKVLYLMLLPAIVATFLFNYLPLSGWYIAFSRYRTGRGIFEGKFVGLENFRTFFVESTDYSYVFVNTLVINILSLLLVIGLSFVFSLLLTELRSARYRKLVQTISFIPYFISWIIAYSLVYAMFSSYSGVVNVVLKNLGVLNQSLNILGDKDYAWGLIICLNIWNKLGYNSIIFISAATGIPADQYEAAAIDGANRWQKVWYVTIPGLIPSLVMLMVINAGWLLNSNFEQFFMFTTPTNWERMEVFDMYIYKFGFQLLNYSYATAIGIVRTVISIALVTLVNWISKATSGKSVI